MSYYDSAIFSSVRNKEKLVFFCINNHRLVVMMRGELLIIVTVRSTSTSSRPRPKINTVILPASTKPNHPLLALSFRSAAAAEFDSVLGQTECWLCACVTVGLILGGTAGQGIDNSQMVAGIHDRLQ